MPNKEPEKVRGFDQVMSWIKQNITEVKEFIDTSGGFNLLSESEDKEY